MPDSPGKAHVVVDLPNTLKVVVVSSNDEPMQGFEGHLEEEDDPEKDQEIDEVVKDKQMDEEAEEDVGQQQVVQEIDEV